MHKNFKIAVGLVAVLIVLCFAFKKDQSEDLVKNAGKNQEQQPTEAEKDFEGEADPSRMTLGMTKWNWISATYSDGKEVKPKVENKFSITFNEKAKTFSASTDCNGIGGEYVAKDGKISFNKMMSTMMFCQDSQEADFSKMLSETGSYFFTSRGELVLELKFDSGSVIFR